jgi:N-acetyl sugar amidotransferase
MKKILGIVVTDYPYGNGELFLYDELKETSKQFDQILIIIPAVPENKKNTKQLFELPSNVFVLPIHNTYTLFDKVFSFLRIGPLKFYSLVRTATKQYGVPFSWGMVKIFMSYEAKEHQFRKKLWRELKKGGYTRQQLVLYSYWLTEYTYALSNLKKKFPNFHVYTRAHGWDVYFERHTPAYLPFRKRIIPILDGTFTVSWDAKNYLVQKLNINEDKIEIGRLGVAGFERNTLIRKKGKLNILTIAFISPVKNLELLIDSLSEVPDRLEINWFHIGNGNGDDYADKIMAYARQMLDTKANINYHFLGGFSSNQIRDFLQKNSVDLLINTSHSEGLPVSMMEAISAGIPIVGPSIGGIPEIVSNGVNGYLLSSKPDAEEIVKTLLHYDSCGEDEIDKMRTNAYNIWELEFNSQTNYAGFASRLNKGLDHSHQVCSRCILDTKDYPEIKFDAKGVCDICLTYDKYYANNVFDGDKGTAVLEEMLSEIKRDAGNNQYDCLIGLSGGVDSTYLAYLTKQWGLRPLILHVDNGWNSELAVKNIENVVSKLGLDLYTYVVNWKEMKDLQKAFLAASVVDMDVPTDNTYIATTYKIARKFKIKHVLIGHNVVTEGWLPPNFNHNKYDLPNIYDIHRKFGSVKLKSIPLIGLAGLWLQKKVWRIKTHSPLNYIPYNKNGVKNTIQTELGWRDYGAKHFENIFTRFYQGYILPEKFGVDKRKAHLSTLICSGQITREEALLENNKPVYDQAQLKEDRNFFIKKLNLTEEEFMAVMKKPPLAHTYYKSLLNTIRRLRPLGRLARKLGLRR